MRFIMYHAFDTVSRDRKQMIAVDFVRFGSMVRLALMKDLATGLLGLGRRAVHLSAPCSSQPPAAGKNLLAQLRKKTGYTISNCKKALELNNNEFDKAEQWLAAQAQALGWARAGKLQGRATMQGLVAAQAQGSHAALLEISCETDFVARNQRFRDLAVQATSACLRRAQELPAAEGQLATLSLDGAALGALTDEAGQPLQDVLALAIGALAENLSLRRAVLLKASAPGLRLAGYAHPVASQSGDVFLGKYGALVAFSEGSATAEDSELLGRELCQHIVGMDPDRVGVPDKDEPAANADEERCLIFQEFLLNPLLTVAERVAPLGVELVAFKRFECGQPDSVDITSTQTPG